MITANYIKWAQFANNGGTEVSRINEIIEKSKIKFNFRFIKGYNKIIRPFIKDLGPHLIKIYDRKGKL